MMLRLKTLLISAILFFSIPISIFAGGLRAARQLHHPFKTYYYVGISAGLTFFSTTNSLSTDFSGGNGGGSAPAYDRFTYDKKLKHNKSLFVGYQWTRNIAFEINVTDWEAKNIEGIDNLAFEGASISGSLHIYSYGASVLGEVPFYENKFKLFARVGINYDHAALTVNDPDALYFNSGGNYRIQSKAWDLVYGLGGDFRVNRAWGLRIFWTQMIRLKQKTIRNLAVHAVGLGLTYQFG